MILFSIIYGYSLIAVIHLDSGLLTSGGFLWDLAIWTTIDLLGCNGWNCLLLMHALLFIYAAILAGYGAYIRRKKVEHTKAE